jgi:hypothetical protein
MKSIITIVFCLLALSNIQAQNPRMFDEYGNISFSDEKARLDNLTVQLQREPDFIAWFVVHPGRKDCADDARARALRAKNYLINTRGIQADRIMWKDGGYHEVLTIEIWTWPRSIGAPVVYSALGKNEVQIVKRCKSKYHKRQR